MYIILNISNIWPMHLQRGQNVNKKNQKNKKKLQAYRGQADVWTDRGKL